MSKKTLYSIILSFISVHYTFSQSIDSAEAKVWANYITDPDIYIGVFENSAPPDMAALDNGNFAEEDPNFVSVSLQHFILKLDTKEKIKGDFDNAIFVQNTTFNHEGNINIQFLPFTRTSLLIGMRKCFKNNMRFEWAGPWAEKISFLNERTAFSIVDYTKGTMYLKYPESRKRPPAYFKTDEFMIKDFKKIISIVMEKIENSEKIAKLKNEINNLNTNFSKAVAHFVLKKI